MIDDVDASILDVKISVSHGRFSLGLPLRQSETSSIEFISGDGKLDQVFLFFIYLIFNCKSNINQFIYIFIYLYQNSMYILKDRLVQFVRFWLEQRMFALQIGTRSLRGGLRMLL